MTKSEIWHLKIGTIVEDVLGWFDNTPTKGKVINREVYDETCSFMIAKEKRTNKVIEKDFYTGRKQICVTVKFDSGSIRYYDTSNDSFRFKNFKVISNS